MDDNFYRLCDIMITLLEKLWQYYRDDNSESAREFIPERACENAIEDIKQMLEDAE